MTASESGWFSWTPAVAGAVTTGRAIALVTVTSVVSAPVERVGGDSETDRGTPAWVKSGVQESVPLRLPGSAVNVAPGREPQGGERLIVSPSGSAAVTGTEIAWFSVPFAVAGAVTTGARSVVGHGDHRGVGAARRAAGRERDGVAAGLGEVRRPGERPAQAAGSAVNVALERSPVAVSDAIGSPSGSGGDGQGEQLILRHAHGRGCHHHRRRGWRRYSSASRDRRRGPVPRRR